MITKEEPKGMTPFGSILILDAFNPSYQSMIILSSFYIVLSFTGCLFQFQHLLRFCTILGRQLIVDEPVSQGCFIQIHRIVTRFTGIFN